jgi:hypothetical protein
MLKEAPLSDDYYVEVSKKKEKEFEKLLKKLGIKKFEKDKVFDIFEYYLSKKDLDKLHEYGEEFAKETLMIPDWKIVDVNI